MTKKLLNLGTVPNDQAGDSLRSAGGKINDNFDEIYAAFGNGTDLTIAAVARSGSYDDLSDKPVIPLDVSQLTDTEGLLGQGGGSSSLDSLVNGEATLSLDNTGLLTLPAGGLIGETVVTENPTIVIQPANPDHETQLLFIKGGVPGFINIENGIEIYTNSQTAVVNDTVTYYVYSEANANTTMYWWVDGTDETSGNTRFNPDNGTVEINESAEGIINFEVLDDSQPFRIFVSDTLYDAYANNNGAVSTYYNESAFVDSSYHLHLTTGDLQETSIFLGTDNHNVRTRSDGAMVLTSYDYDNEQTYTLTLKNNELRVDSTNNPNDEDLYVKAGDDLYLDALDDDIHIRSNDDTRIRIGYDFSNDTYQYQYHFNSADGGLTISDYDNGDFGSIYPHTNETGLGVSIESAHDLLLKSAYGNNTWVLGDDGVTYVPNSISFEGSGRINNSVSDGGGLQIEGISDFEIKVTQGEGQETAIYGFNSNGVIELPVGGDITMDGESVLGGGLRTVEVPTSSAGSEGDQEGDLAFSNTHMYYCSSTYSATPVTVSWSNVTNFIVNPNYIQADIANPSQLSGVLQVTNCAVNGVTGVTITIASVELVSGNTYKLFPVESGFESTYGNSELINVGLSIWKRVAWSGDTW